MAERIQKGQRLPGIDAASWNEFVDAAERVKRLPPPGGKPGPVASLSRALTISCKNTSGADYTADFPIVRLVDPVITPADYAAIVHQGLVIEADDPDSTNAHWGVMQGPCVDGREQQTVVSGYTWATVNIVSTSHTTCGPTSGEATKLTSGKSGAAIVYQPAGTGDQVCLVRIGGNVAAWAVGTLDAGMTTGGATTATLTDYGGGPGQDGYPANATGKITFESNFNQSHASGTKLFGVLSDPTADPPVYEVPKDDGTGGSGGSLPDAGCGLEYADATTLQVDIETLAGAGLGFSTSAAECDHADDETATYCCLYVDYGCGLTVTGGKLTVNVDGCLSCDSETGVLSISVGCGLLCSGGDLVVDTAALAGKGLSASASSGDCDATGTGGAYCCLTVNLGCGLEFSGDDIQVKNDDLAGTGLTPEGTCALGVDYDPTYFIINPPSHPTQPDKLSMNCDPITGVTCALTKDGTNLKLTLTLSYCSGKSPTTTECTLAGVETCE